MQPAAHLMEILPGMCKPSTTEAPSMAMHIGHPRTLEVGVGGPGVHEMLYLKKGGGGNLTGKRNASEVQHARLKQ